MKVRIVLLDQWRVTLEREITEFKEAMTLQRELIDAVKVGGNAPSELGAIIERDLPFLSVFIGEMDEEIRLPVT